MVYPEDTICSCGSCCDCDCCACDCVCCECRTWSMDECCRLLQTDSCKLIAVDDATAIRDDCSLALGWRWWWLRHWWRLLMSVAMISCCCDECCCWPIIGLIGDAAIHAAAKEWAVGVISDMVPGNGLSSSFRHVFFEFTGVVDDGDSDMVAKWLPRYNLLSDILP